MDLDEKDNNNVENTESIDLGSVNYEETPIDGEAITEENDIKSDLEAVTKKKHISRKKIFTICISLVVLINILIAVYLIFFSKLKSSLQLEIYNKTELSYLEALNAGAKKGFIKNGQYASFKFSDLQKKELYELFNENKNISLTVRLHILETTRQSKLSDSSFQFGFLFSKDFSNSGKLIEKNYPDNSRTLVKGNLDNAPEFFDVSFALKNKDLGDDYIPEGFFVYSSVPCQVIASCIVPLELGFDLTGEVPFYGFSSNGGVIDFSNTTFDFSGAPLVLPNKTLYNASLPEFCIKLSDNKDNKSSIEKNVYSSFNFGGEKIEINNVGPAEEVVIPSGGLKAPFSPMRIYNNPECITAVLLRPTYIAGEEVVKPVRTDPGLILDYNNASWRILDYELFEWDRYPKILFFDTKDYNIQDKFFRRLAYFVEKNGYKGRLLSDEELKGKHGYNAHDYSAISMAAFFNKAQKEGFKLNEYEMLLKKILIENKLFEADGDFVKPNEGGLVSISQESTPQLRKTFLAHEGWHTIFFRDEEFRNFVSAVYYTLDSHSRDWLADYFTANPSLQYDTNDDYLMKNEFMAYIMQQDLSQVGDYFTSLARRSYVRAYTPVLSDYIIKTHARGFEDAAYALNDFVFDKYGIVCGNISLVSK